MTRPILTCPSLLGSSTVWCRPMADEERYATQPGSLMAVSSDSITDERIDLWESSQDLVLPRPWPVDLLTPPTLEAPDDEERSRNRRILSALLVQHLKTLLDSRNTRRSMGQYSIGLSWSQRHDDRHSISSCDIADEAEGEPICTSILSDTSLASLQTPTPFTLEEVSLSELFLERRDTSPSRSLRIGSHIKRWHQRTRLSPSESSLRGCPPDGGLVFGVSLTLESNLIRLTCGSRPDIVIYHHYIVDIDVMTHAKYNAERDRVRLYHAQNSVPGPDLPQWRHSLGILRAKLIRWSKYRGVQGFVDLPYEHHRSITGRYRVDIICKQGQRMTFYFQAENERMLFLLTLRISQMASVGCPPIGLRYTVVGSHLEECKWMHSKLDAAAGCIEDQYIRTVNGLLPRPSDWPALTCATHLKPTGF